MDGPVERPRPKRHPAEKRSHEREHRGRFVAEAAGKHFGPNDLEAQGGETAGQKECGEAGVLRVACCVKTRRGRLA